MLCNPPFFSFFNPRMRSTYNNVFLSFLIIFIFLFCLLFLIFDIYITWFLRSIKTWLSERFSLLSRYESLLLHDFLFCLNDFILLYSYQFLFSFSSLLWCLFCYCCFCHCHCHYYFFFFNAFKFSFSSFYHSVLSLYVSNIFKF